MDMTVLVVTPENPEVASVVLAFSPDLLHVLVVDANNKLKRYSVNEVTVQSVQYNQDEFVWAANLGLAGMRANTHD
jgi:hypothetical protein